jgi:hypothetical protein
VWRSPRRRAATVAAAVVFVPVATAVQLWRVSGESVWRTVWFEDGTVFYRDALDLPLTETFAKPYNGYGHALPRVLATVGSWLPPEWYSAWAAVSSTFVVSMLALFIYFASAPLLRAPLRRGILAASLLVLPVLSLEVLAALSNLQWMLPIACLFAVLFPVDGWGGIAVRAAIVVVVPLTSPLSLVVAPFALYQLVMFLRRRDRWRRFVVPVLYLGACLGQLLVYLWAEHRPLNDAAQPPLGDVLDDIADLYTVGVLIYGGLDTEVSSELWRSSSSWLGWVATAVVSALLLVKLRRAESTARWWIAGFAVASPAVFAFVMVQRSELVAPALSFLPYDIRYWVVPQFLLLVALLVPPVVNRGLLVGSPGGAGVEFSTTDAGVRAGGALTGGLPWVTLSVLTVAWLAVAVVPSYRRDVGRSKFPSWPDEVAEAQAACRVDPTAPQVIEVSPGGWRLQMTCAQLDAGDS